MVHGHGEGRDSVVVLGVEVETRPRPQEQVDQRVVVVVDGEVEGGLALGILRKEIISFSNAGGQHMATLSRKETFGILPKWAKNTIHNTGATRHL